MLRIILASFLLSFGIAVHAQVGDDKLLDALKNDNLAEAIKIVRGRAATDPSSRIRLAERVLDEASRRGPGDHQRIEARGDVAQLAGSCSTAIVLYQQTIDGLQSHYEKYLKPHGGKYWVPYNVMYKAATCSFRLGDHANAFSYLESIEKYGDTWVKKLGEDKSKALREFVAAPRTTATSIKFARDFWTGNVPAMASTYYDVEDFLNQTLELGPITREQTKEILSLMHTTAQSFGDLGELDRQVKRLTNAFGGEDFVLEAALDLATKLPAEKRFADAEGWLKWLSEHGKGKPRFITQVAITRANIAEKNGDEAAMLRELLSAFNTPGTGEKGMFGAASHDHYVTKRLARYYKEKGNYTEALKYFTALVPGGSGCGTCDAEMRYERDFGIGECLIKLGREDEALEKHLMPYLTRDGGSPRPDVARLVVSVHEKRGDLEGFVSRILPLAANVANRAAQTALRMSQIRLSSQKGEVDKLVSEIRHTGSHNLAIRFQEARGYWEPVAIAEALADQNGREFPAIKKRYEYLKSVAGQDAIAARIWLIYALGVSRAPEAEAYLRELLTAKEFRDEITFALSMKKTK
jgi:tetratricopeptide (TPR) repeat protein